MKNNDSIRIALLTLYGNNNYGNKLQNYASQVLLNSYSNNVETIKNRYDNTFYRRVIFIIKNIIKYFLSIFIKKYRRNNNIFTILKKIKRTNNFKKFDSFISKNREYLDINHPDFKRINNYDVYVVGSDQVWNPGQSNSIPKLFLLNDIDDSKLKFSLSSSISIDHLTDLQIESANSSWTRFDAISVREEKAKELIENNTNVKNVTVLLDPTMLISIDKWYDVINKPMKFDKYVSNSKYILNYFLGDYNSNYKKEIEQFARINNYKIINILDSNDPFYVSGPSEFLWLIKNSSIVFTDSFHATVFSILFNVPFLVFNRDDGQVGKNSMSSRLDNLLKKFHLSDKYYDGVLNSSIFDVSFDKVNSIIQLEQKKANDYLDNLFFNRGE